MAVLVEILSKAVEIGAKRGQTKQYNNNVKVLQHATRNKQLN